MTQGTTGWNPDGTPGMGYDNVEKGEYVITPPIFALEAKQRQETGPMWIGRAHIEECVSGSAAEVGSEVGIFLYDPQHSIMALSGMRVFLARHGLSPEGLALGDMAALVPQLNELLTYGNSAHVLVNDNGYVQDTVVRLPEGQSQVLVVFEDFAFFDLGRWPEEGGRYCYRIEKSAKFMDKRGNPQVNYRSDVHFRVVSLGPWQNHLVQYSFLNYTLSAYLGDGGMPFIGPSGSQTNKKQETNFTRFLAVVGISNVVEQVLVPGGEELTARAREAAEDKTDPLHRPYIFEWIKRAALEMRAQGHVMVGDIDSQKGFLNGKTLQVAGHVQIKQIGMPDVIPDLISLEGAKASGLTPRQPSKAAASTSATPDLDTLLPVATVAGAYNEWANQTFNVMVFEMVDGVAAPVEEYKRDDQTISPIQTILVPYVLPVLNYGSPDVEKREPGKLGLSRNAPCRMSQNQLNSLLEILKDDAYVAAVSKGDSQAVNEVLAGFLDITEEAKEILDQGF